MTHVDTIVRIFYASLIPLLSVATLCGCSNEPAPSNPPTDGVSVNVNDAKLTDEDRIQGQWQLVRSVRSGQEIPSEQLAVTFFRFSGNRWIPGRDENDYSTFTLNPAASPPQIDITDRDGNTMLGIYDLTGNALVLCIARAGEKRPSRLESDRACNGFLIGLQR